MWGPIRFAMAKNDPRKYFPAPVDLCKRGMGRVMVVLRARCMFRLESPLPSPRSFCLIPPESLCRTPIF